MSAKATFRIEDCFRITGRGIAFAGEILTGEIQIGDSITFKLNSQAITRRITGVEGIRSSRESVNVGLVIESMNENELEEFKNWKPKQTIAEIVQKDEN